eukprot:11290124-Prorocentrum_lima.AAC.1
MDAFVGQAHKACPRQGALCLSRCCVAASIASDPQQGTAWPEAPACFPVHGCVATQALLGGS